MDKEKVKHQKEERKAAKRMEQQKKRNRKMILVALFMAIIFILAFTPIGFIQTPIIKATIIHVPVIIGAIVLGPGAGAILGASFGLASLISNTIAPTLLSFAFTPAVMVPGSSTGSALSLLICFVPRILVGIVPYYVYKFFQKLFKKNSKAEYVSLVLGGIAGSLTNTILVMGLIYVFFKNAYALAKHIPVKLVSGIVMGIIGTNGIPEAIVAAVLTVALGKVLLKITRKNNRIG